MDHLVSEPRPLSGEHTIAGGFDCYSVKINLLVTGHVDGRQQQSQSNSFGVNGWHKDNIDLWAKDVLLLHVNVFSAWTGIWIHKVSFRPLVFESWSSALPLNYWTGCMWIIGDLNSTIVIGECEEIGGDVLCHDNSFHVMM